ncbi:hypothetical protein C9I98_06645 [Photobacterium sanctipauli]|uniref:Uncharacterized protein n=1 Tax=Photobacterium sanctipauli TaxID=1342794 RepID=A0A2T3NW94_9GAMM|nr:hypothetical protein [Photobacterium sanctipauli]PSW20525.1 hypothetical protein C9I98_06645 [Photobacterium sanctipauli]
MKQAKNKFSVGDVVIVNGGMVDPDFGQEISGWIGTVEKVRHFDDAGFIHSFMYKVRWNRETLADNSVLRVSCEELGLDFETMQLTENDLSLCSSARGKKFIKHCLHLPKRKRAYSYGDFAFS